MPRIRTVKPEYWTSEQAMNLSLPARLLFIGMWNFCDDAGVHPASVRTLKAEVLPCDDVDTDSIVAELLVQGLIIEYRACNKPYWHVTGWHHQKIEKPTFKHPLPSGKRPRSHDEVKAAFDEYSARNPRDLTPGREGSLREGSLREGN